MDERVFYWAMLVMSACLNSLGAFLIKLNLNKQGPLLLETVGGIVGYLVALLKRPQVLLGFALWIVSPFMFALALSRIELTVGQPVFIILNFFLIFVNGVFFLKERITPQRGVAVVLAAVSVVFFSLG